MAQTIVPKSDQLNADDLIAGPLTITITKVAANMSSVEQPVSVFFEGDNGKPYKPCKSMRRVMVAAWGVDASTYVGRSMTLFRDPTVTWGGMAVGGIRISHMSHIERDMPMVLTASKTKRAPVTIKRLTEGAAGAQDKPKPEGKYLLLGRRTDDLAAWKKAFLANIAKRPQEGVDALRDEHADHLQAIATGDDPEASAAAWEIIDAMAKAVRPD